MTLLDVDIDTRFQSIVRDVVMCDDPDCERIAVWGSDCPTCGDTVHACDEHRVQLDEWIAHQHQFHPGGYLLCNKCRQAMPHPLPWHPI